MERDGHDTDAPPPGGPGPALEGKILAALDALLHALALEPLADDRFRAASEPGRFADRVFGGQLLAQALLAAGRTTSGQAPRALHASFVEAGLAARPLELAVERVRDGRSLSLRQVAVRQEGRTLLVATASFHGGPGAPHWAEPAPAAPPPDALPTLQAWIEHLPAPLRDANRTWLEQPPPLDFRLDEPPRFAGGARAEEPRLHWLRVPRATGDDPLLDAALLAYASDYLMLDAALRSHPEQLGERPFVGFSMDHALWFHRPSPMDGWHLYCQQAQAIAGHHGLARGQLYDAAGRLVATTMQESLLREA